ncbi:MAG TPA: ABC transporter ATP-binding protein, partial [Gaiellaceae bacterium]|nr:ABC transporter ATP-binding protein [Gaiellaceae bacterium]
MSAQPAAGLLIDRVSKDLGGRRIVDGLELEVRAGELTCLLGPSGCGKTTTLRMIGGFLHPDAGRILIDGEDVGALAPERRPTAMVFQNYALWPHMTVFKNVAFGLRLRKLPKAEIKQRVERMLELVGLTHHMTSYPARISGGEQQRVALARALVLEPKVLLLDEPLSNLDAKLRVRVREDIREIQQRIGITTVFVTHDQDEALSISDRIAVMNEGNVEQYADARSLYREPGTTFVANFV